MVRSVSIGGSSDRYLLVPAIPFRWLVQEGGVRSETFFNECNPANLNCGRFAKRMTDLGPGKWEEAPIRWVKGRMNINDMIGHLQVNYEKLSYL